MNPLVPLGILFLLPLSAIGLVLYTDAGLVSADTNTVPLFWAAAKTTVILVVVGAAISFAASKLAERTNG